MLGELVLSGLLIVIATAILKAWIRHQQLRQILNKIPGSNGIPFFGDAFHLKRDDLGFFNQIHDYCRQHADKGIIKVWTGPQVLAFVFRAETVEPCLKGSKHTTKGFQYNFLKPWLADGLLLSIGQKWHERRRLITPTFHFQILEQFAHVFNENASLLVRLLDAKSDGPEFVVQPFIYHCMLDSICETAMGVKIHAQEDTNSPYITALYRMAELIQLRYKYPWMWPECLFRMMSSGREHSRCLKVLHDFTRKVIRDRMRERDELTKTGEGHKVSKSEKSSDDNIYTTSKRRRMAFIDMLLSEKSLNEDDIQEEVDTFMFEGHDTTAAGMVWILYMLAAHPEFQVKVQQEIDAVIGTEMRDVTLEDIQKLHFTELFIKETFRLYPPVPWISRVITEPCTIGGYDLPEGVTVALSMFELHRDPAHFPDPLKFDPDRWSDEAAKRHPFCYIPFSAGNRNCIGQRFALLELKVVLCHLMHNFTVTWSFKRDDLIPVNKLIMKQENSLPIKLERRHV